MILHTQLRKFIIQPTLNSLDKYSKSAEELLILTVAQESLGGKYIHQIEGPAVGIFQMEPTTHDDIWNNYLAYREDLSDIIHGFQITPEHPDAREMIGNIYYAAAMARVHYLRVPEVLPEAEEIQELAKYYKKFYNTAAGEATVGQAIQNYENYIND